MATIEQLYQQILGRSADPGGLAYYQNLFGPTLEPEEVNVFLRGALASGEVSDISSLQPAADRFIGLMQTGQYGEAAQVAQQAGYSPADVATYVNDNAAGLGLGPETGFAGVSAADVASLYTPTPTLTSAAVTPPTYQGANRDQIIGLYRSVGLPDPAEEDISWWQNFSRTNPDVVNASNPLTQLTNAFTAASRQALTPSTLPATAQSQIDPIIAPYLSEALGVARSLFLEGEGPKLFPGQMFVGPSAQTLSALSGMETIAGAAQPFYEQAATGVMSGLTGLERTASGGFLGGSPYRDEMIAAATRPLTQQFTEEVMPGIQSTFSRAGRLGSEAQGAVTGRATEGFTRALGDVTSRIAAEDYARERGFQEAATRDVLLGAGRLGDITSSFLAPSNVLADVGARREAIAGQPLAESMRRFDYTQNLPQDQFARYMASIYGSPLGTRDAAEEMRRNSTLQNIGGFLNVAGAIPDAARGVQTGYNFLSGLLE